MSPLSCAGGVLWLVAPILAGAWLFLREPDGLERLPSRGGRGPVAAAAVLAILGALGGRVAVAGVAVADVALPLMCAVAALETIARRRGLRHTG
jgi:hypothetical protein